MRALSRFFFRLKWYKLSRLCHKGEYAKQMLLKIQGSLEAMADAFGKIADMAKQCKGGLEEDNEENETTQGNE